MQNSSEPHLPHLSPGRKQTEHRRSRTPTPQPTPGKTDKPKDPPKAKKIKDPVHASSVTATNKVDSAKAKQGATPGGRVNKPLTSLPPSIVVNAPVNKNPPPPSHEKKPPLSHEKKPPPSHKNPPTPSQKKTSTPSQKKTSAPSQKKTSIPSHKNPPPSSHKNPSSIQPDIPKRAAVDAARKDAQGAINNLDIPKRLTLVLKTWSKVNSTIENIVAIHPYAQAAWSILSFAPKVATEQTALDGSVHTLFSKMDEAYIFISQPKWRGIKSVEPLIVCVYRQTLECSYFIREYAQNKKFRTRLLKNFFSETKERIQDYSNNFDKLMQLFRDKSGGDTMVVVHRIWERVGNLDQDLDLNSMPYIEGAGLDTRKICLEGTRNDVLDEIRAWVNNTKDNTYRVFLLHGNAGTGKSSIAHTIADHFQKLDRLGSCYCFDHKKPAQHRHEKIFTMIARDLADRDEQMRRKLASAIHRNTSLKYTTDLLQQWKELIMKPARAFSEKMAGPVVIVIDALDESGGPDTRELLLRILAGKLRDEENHILKLPPHFRILLTARSLPDILNALDGVKHVRSKPMDSIPRQSTEHDIIRYISGELCDVEGMDIRKVSATLAVASGGLFEWARLACAYITGDNDIGLTVQERYEAVMAGDKDTHVPLLDSMYKLTLESIFPKELPQRLVRLDRFRSVMAQVISTAEPLPLSSLASMRHHFPDKHLQQIDVNTVIKPMGALLSGTTDRFAVIRPLHASFSEFLTHESRSREFFISCSDIHKELAFACFGVMEDELRFNICKFPSSYLANSDIADLAKRVKRNISPVLSYSCRFWAYHLQRTKFNLPLAKMVRAFFATEKLLFWLEVMSLLKDVRISISSLSIVIRWTMTHTEGKDLAEDAADIQRFIRVFAVPISHSTPHLYVSAIPFSPTNSYISKKFADKFGKVLHVVSGRHVTWSTTRAVLRGHSSSVHSAIFSPDGKHIVSGSGDGTIRLWDAETGEPLRPPLKGHGGPVWPVAFSPDGKCIASGSNDRTIRLWDAGTGELICPPLKGHKAWIRSIAFSPDGKCIVSASGDRTIRLWNAATGKLLRPPLEGHRNSVSSVVFSPDGKVILSGSDDRTIRLWDVGTGKLVRRPLEGHKAWVSSVAFSRDGKFIVSGSGDKTIRLWDTTTGELLHPPLEGHEDYVQSVAFSPDGKSIVSGSDDRTIRLWDARKGKPLQPPLEGHGDSVWSVAFSPDGKGIISGSMDSTIWLWDAEMGPLHSLHGGHAGYVWSVAFSPDGKCIMSGTGGGTIQLWDAGTGKSLRPPLKGHRGPVVSVAFSSDGKSIASGSKDMTIRLWDAKTGEPLRPPLKGHKSCIWSIAFSPNNKCIVSGSDDKTIRLWDVGTGRPLRRLLEGHEGPVRSVAFSPDGKHIMSGSCDRTIKLWDVATGELLHLPFEGHDDYVHSVAFSPDGKSVVSGSDDKTIRLWDARTGKLLQPPFKGHEHSVCSAAFSHNGKHIVSGSKDRTIRIWDASTGKLLQPPLEGHEGYVLCVTFSPDGKTIASGSRDGTIRLWDAGMGELQKLPLEGRYIIGFSPQLEHALVLPAEHANRISSVPTDLAKVTGQGWVHVRPNSDILFWAPSTYRLQQYFPRPATLMTIPVSNTHLDLSHMAHGHLWDSCYGKGKT